MTISNLEECLAHQKRDVKHRNDRTVKDRVRAPFLVDKHRESDLEWHGLFCIHNVFPVSRRYKQWEDPKYDRFLFLLKSPREVKEVDRSVLLSEECKPLRRKRQQVFLQKGASKIIF